MSASAAASHAAKAGVTSVTTSAARRSHVNSLKSLNRSLRTVARGPLSSSSCGSLVPDRASRDVVPIIRGAHCRVEPRYMALLPRGSFPSVVCLFAAGGEGCNDASSSTVCWLVCAAAVAAASATATDTKDWRADENGGWSSGSRTGRVQCRGREVHGSSPRSHSPCFGTQAPTSRSTPRSERLVKDTVPNATAGDAGLTRPATAITKDGVRRGGEGGGAGRGAHGDPFSDTSDEESEALPAADDTDKVLRIVGVDRRRRGNLERATGVPAAAPSAPAPKVAHDVDEEFPGARITDVYRFDSSGTPVGRGNRSTVYECTHRLTGQPVAVKRISRTHSSRLEVR